jgi:hypothetical protein
MLVTIEVPALEPQKECGDGTVGGHGKPDYCVAGYSE